MENKLDWFNLPSTAIKFFSPSNLGKPCLNDEGIEDLLSDMYWLNTPNKMLEVLQKIESLLSGYEAPIKLNWWNLPVTLMEEYNKIIEIDC